MSDAQNTPHIQNTQGTPGAEDDADTASGGAPEQADHGSDDQTDQLIADETTDDEGMPLENPSGG